MADSPEKHTFQAETRQLLDIVIHSLYTDKEIFVRELVSNAADALEKLRLTQLTEKEVFDEELPLEIHIDTDEEGNTLTISDYGIGMTHDELTENLGTIAHSGSKKFLQALNETEQKESALIGQFGVGFYSAFMVADDVKVYTHSWKTDGENLVWSSDGESGYEIEKADDQKRGCKIVLKLRDEQKEYAGGDRIKGILENYSNFVPFPILLNGERVNTVEALWRKSKSDISDEDYSAFYKFTAKAFDEPRYRMHFSADAPLEINALVFVPEQNSELFGFGQMEPGVSLYCKNVLIDDKPDGLLPEWLRFLRGVIDSSDLPLNISRESMQDSALVQKLNKVVTKRFLKFLDGEARKNTEKYEDFYKSFSRFLKEGVAMDSDNREALAKLLRFESSMSEPGVLTGLEEYLTRAKEDQEEIYFLVGENRESVEAGPYVEAFKARGLEVIYFTEPIDHFVVRSLLEYKEKKLVPVDRADIDLPEDEAAKPKGRPLAKKKVESLCEFIKEELGDRVEKVEAGDRLIGSPVAALSPEDHLDPQMRAMMKSLNPDEEPPPIKVQLEINPRHGLIKKLAAAQEVNPDLAKLVTEQLFENALLAAGLLEEKKDLIQRGFDLMDAALGTPKK